MKVKVPKLRILSRDSREVVCSNSTSCTVLTDEDLVYYSFKLGNSESILITVRLRENYVEICPDMVYTPNIYKVNSGDYTIVDNVQAYIGRVVRVPLDALEFEEHEISRGVPPELLRGSMFRKYRHNPWYRQASLLCAFLWEQGYVATTSYFIVDGIRVNFNITEVNTQPPLPFYRPRPHVNVHFLVVEGRVRPERALSLKRARYKIFAVTNYGKKRLEEVGLEVIDVIPHAVDTDTFRPLEMRKDIDFLYIVRWNHPRKRTDVFRVVTEGIGRSFLHVSSQKHISTIKLVELYNRAYCYLSTTSAEGFNIPLLEAMACNLYVIANKLPVYDFVPEECLVEPKLVKEVQYYNAIYEWCEPDIEKLRQKCQEVLPLVKTGKLTGLREHALKYDYRVVFRRFLKHIDEIIKERS